MVERSEELTVEEKAVLLIEEVKQALRNGTLHYRESDGALLRTPEEILIALVDEGKIIFQPIK